MDFSKLAKVLAMAASDNDTEALHALRTARRLLESEGSDFVELSRHLAEAAAAGTGGIDREVLEDTIFDLRNEIRHLRAENERLKQTPPPAPTPVAEPPRFHDSARAEASVIRLRAELDDLREALEAERAEALRLQAHEATFHQSFQEAIAEAGRLSARLTEADARRMRLEAENRRLSHANHALEVELGEVKAQQARFAAELVAHEVRQDLNGSKPKPTTRRRAKGGVQQYALF